MTKDEFVTRDINLASWIVMILKMNFGEEWKEHVVISPQHNGSGKAEFTFSIPTARELAKEYIGSVVPSYLEALSDVRDIVYSPAFKQSPSK